MSEHARNGLVATFERIAGTRHPEPYVLRLYVAGMTAMAMRAITNVREMCDQHLDGRYDLEVIDLYQQPGLAKDEQITAAPTLVKKSPLPLRRIIGDMSKRDRLLLGLGLDQSRT